MKIWIQQKYTEFHMVWNLSKKKKKNSVKLNKRIKPSHFICYHHHGNCFSFCSFQMAIVGHIHDPFYSVAFITTLSKYINEWMVQFETWKKTKGMKFKCEHHHLENDEYVVCQLKWKSLL